MSDNLVNKNDIVILYKSRTKTYMLHPKELNKTMQISHNDVIGKEYNTKYKNCYILRPYPSIYTDTVKRQTQILFEADMSLVLFYLNIQEKSRIIESGTGSGVFTHFISKHIKKGHLYTFERNLERYNNLLNNFNENVTIKNCDLYEYTFTEDEKNVDAVFLDLPEPWKLVEKCYDVLKNNGRICIFVPNVEQVVLVRDELKQHFEEMILLENIKREYINFENKNMVLRDGQYSHTGFLIFASKF